MLQTVRIRKTKRHDLPLLLAWRHNQQVMEFFVDGFEVWEHHRAWFDGIVRSGMVDSFIIEYEGRPVGQVHVDWRNSVPDVGIYIGDITLWGKGIGTTSIQMLIEYAYKKRKPESLTACIHQANVRSRGLFKKVGFNFERLRVDGFHLYRFDCRAFMRSEIPVPAVQAGNRQSDLTCLA